jgi:hypothetical protein
VPEVKVKITLDGKTADAMDVPITQSNEHWSEYKLEDGTTLRVKFAVGSIIRLDDKQDAEGNPVYMIKGNVVSIPIVPDSQQKKN